MLRFPALERDEARDDAGAAPDGNRRWRRTLAARLLLARAALLWERAWPELWPAAGVAGLFVTVAWLNLLPMLPAAVHFGILAVFALVFFHLLGRGLGRLAWPGRATALRRLEQDSGLTHRPLQTLEDRPAGSLDHPMAGVLWAQHRAAAEAAVRHLRNRLPRPNLAARDTRALRGLIFLLLVAAGVGAWGHWGDRLAQAMQPRLAGFATGGDTTLDIWIDPPDYTGQAPVFLSGSDRGTGTGTDTSVRAGTGRAGIGPRPANGQAGAGDGARAGADAGPGTPFGAQPPDDAADRPVRVPEGSRLLARVSGAPGPRFGADWGPELILPEGRHPFRRIDGRNHEVDAVLQHSGAVAVEHAGAPLGRWTVEVVRDQPPEVGLTTLPSVTARGTLRIDYRAADDYGVTRVGGRLILATDVPPGLVDDPPLVLDLPAPGGASGGGGGTAGTGSAGREATGTSYHDLTPHPWAGYPARLTLVAEDGAGQTGRSETVTVMIPERVFDHPVARAIIAERRRLLSYGAAVRPEVAEALAELSARPDHFHQDLVVFLALRVTVARLLSETAPASALAEVAPLLWETALRLEDGGVTLAEREVRAAGQALAEALERGADGEEVRRLMAELQEALDRYMQALNEQMQRAAESGAPMPQVPDDLPVDRVNRQDLDALMQQMQELAETGAYDSARDMLSQLQSFLENLQTGPLQMPGQNQAWSLLEDLQGLAQDQETLLDEAFEQGRRMERDAARQRGEAVPGDPEGGRWTPGQSLRTGDAQHDLRMRLGEVMRQSSELLDQIPEPLGQAEQAMRQAERALQLGMPQAAVPAQSEALDHLHQGLESFAQQLAERMAGFNPGLSGQPQAGRMGRDPLGRPTPGAGRLDDSSVDIPEQGTVQRAREILQELRRRAGEADRPAPEQNYIRRLLDLF